MIIRCREKSIKKILRIPIVQKSISYLISRYLWFVYKTTRWTFRGQEEVYALLKDDQSIIVSFWHNQMALCPFAWFQGYPFRMLISPHFDGIIISDVVRYFGIETIYGSSSKETFSAVRSLLKALQKGQSIGITPDGPKGPRETVKEGIAVLALLSQKPVFCLSVLTRHFSLRSSWDHFKIPLPFSKGIVMWKQVHQCAQDDRITLKKKIAQTLETVTKNALEEIFP